MTNYDIDKVPPRPWEWHCDDTHEFISDANGECIFSQPLDDDDHKLMHIACCINNAGSKP